MGVGDEGPFWEVVEDKSSRRRVELQNKGDDEQTAGFSSRPSACLHVFETYFMIDKKTETCRAFGCLLRT
jgi:hypothetical protein